MPKSATIHGGVPVVLTMKGVNPNVEEDTACHNGARLVRVAPHGLASTGNLSFPHKNAGGGGNRWNKQKINGRSDSQSPSPRNFNKAIICPTGRGLVRPQIR